MLDDIYKEIIWKDRLDPIDVVEDKEIYVPWFLACYQEKFPYWFGKPDPSNEVIRRSLQNAFEKYVQWNQGELTNRQRVNKRLNTLKIFVLKVLMPDIMTQLWRVPRTYVQHSETLHSHKPVVVSRVAIWPIQLYALNMNKVSSISLSKLSPSFDS